MIDADFFADFSAVEESLYLARSRDDESLSLNVIESPYWLDAGDWCLNYLTADVILFGGLVANAGQATLSISQCEAFAGSELLETHFPENGIPNDGDFYPVFVKLRLRQKLQAGVTLLTIRNNSINAPNHIIKYHDTYPKFLKLDELHYFFPVADKSPIQSVSITLPPLYPQLNLTVNTVRPGVLRLFGQTHPDTLPRLWGSRNGINLSNEFWVSPAVSPIFYHFQDEKVNFPGTQPAAVSRFHSEHHFSVLNATPASVHLSLLPLSGKAIKLRGDQDIEKIQSASDISGISGSAIQHFQIPITLLETYTDRIEIEIVTAENLKPCGILKLRAPDQIIQPQITLAADSRISRFKVDHHLLGSSLPLPLIFECRGVGRHSILVRNKLTGATQFADIQNDTKGTTRIAIKIPIDTQLVHSLIHTIPIEIDTGCYLVNQRFFQIQVLVKKWIRIVPYPKYLEFDLDTMESGKQHLLVIEREDEEPVRIQLSHDEDGLFEMKQLNASKWSVRLNRLKVVLKNNQYLTQIHYRDEISQANGMIPVRIIRESRE